MIIHSTVPAELIFAEFDRLEQQKLREMEIDGVSMIVELTGDNAGRIVRLLSPNPQDYLNPRFAPGNSITFRPNLS